MTDDIRTWRVDAPGQTLVLASAGGRLPEVIHWGAPLPEDEDLRTLWGATRTDITGGMLDEAAEPSICPEASRSFPGQPGMVITRDNGSPIEPRLRFAGADELALSFRDEALGLTYVARFEVSGALIIARAELQSDAPIRVHWLAAPTVPGAQASDEMIGISGRWCGEFQLGRVPWRAGIHMREARTGRSGHEHFPGLYVPSRGATNTGGPVWALHYGWSGGHRMVAEELPDGRRQIQFGHATGTEREAGTAFETAPLYLAYGEGLNGPAVAFQRHIRESVPFPDRSRARPVHYNCWEAVYFRHDLDELKDIASRAAALGAERFVLDDGWFGTRDDDTRALGDWTVAAHKYPDGLGPLIAHVQAQGMAFGLWVEPEMVNEDSDLYRAHPDWVLGDAEQVRGRQQMVLDMARAEVRDHLFDALSALLTEYDIDYLKWDHNRLLPVADAAQTRGLYALIDRLRAAHPGVEIESCASGGGRIDFGILSRTHRVWLSDSNDALERLRMQHDAALFLPMCVTGSHVGPRVCHTSGRTLPMALRAWVAAERHLGIEMDPRELTEAETETLTRVIAWWKANRDWMTGADILRLDSDDAAVTAEMHAGDGRFVVFAGKHATSAQIAPRPLRLTGLEAAAHYRVELVNREDVPRLSRGNVALKDGPVEASGAWLMVHGVTLPWTFPETMFVLEGHRI